MAIVTVSRLLGSHGEEIAHTLATRVGAIYVDGDAISQEARKYHLPTRGDIPEISERKPALFDRLREERRKYAYLLRSLLYDFAERDNVVILGHGAEAVLRDLNHVLRVKIYAPFDLRVRRIAEHRGCEIEAAREEVRRSDRDRAGYLRYLFQFDWMDPEIYDLFISTEKLDLEAAVDLLAQARAATALRATMTSLQILQNRAVAGRVGVRLLTDPDVQVGSLRVSAVGGEVTVRGIVSSEEEKQIARSLVANTRGVTAVNDELVVMVPVPIQEF